MSAGLSAWRLSHYTMLRMKNKPTPAPDRVHSWEVFIAQARAIQEDLRRHWEGTDHFHKIRTIAGLDASFILTGYQALQIPANPRLLLRRANRAIGCVMVYRYPEMEQIARSVAVLPLSFPYVPGLLSFREIPVLLAALAKLDALPDLLFATATATHIPAAWDSQSTWAYSWTVRRSDAPRAC